MHAKETVVLDLELCEELARAGFFGVSARNWRDFDDRAFRQARRRGEVQAVPPTLLERLEGRSCQTEDRRRHREGSASAKGHGAAESLGAQGLLPGLLIDPVPLKDDRHGQLSVAADLYDVVARAYRHVGGRYSTDRVIADPIRSYEFVQECWELGASASAYELNWALFNARKAGKLAGLANAERYSLPRESLDKFAFASEFALRALQERYYYDKQLEISLDRVLCDPILAGEFEEIARRVKPGHSSFEYRWAMIILRKARRSHARAADPPERRFHDIGCTESIRLRNIPEVRGLYWFQADAAPLYLGVTENLRAQIDLHFQTSGTKVVPKSLDDRDYGAVRLAILEAPDQSASDRESMKHAWLPSLTPRLNYLSDRITSLLGAA